jgi:hypothetical protein
MIARSAFGLGSGRRSLQRRIADINVLGNQLEVVEGVGDSLLLGQHGIVDGRHTVAATRQCQLKRRLIQTDLRLQAAAASFVIRLSPIDRRRHFLQDDRNHIGALAA